MIVMPHESPSRRLAAFVLFHRKAMAVALSLIVVGATGTVIVTESPHTSTTAQRGIPVSFSVAPSVLPLSHGYQSYVTTAPSNLTLLGEEIQLWELPAPVVNQTVVARNLNVTPLIQSWANSTGNLTALLPSYYLSNVKNWTAFYRSQGETGSQTSLQLMVTYVFRYNSTLEEIFQYAHSVPYNPSSVISDSSLTISVHPNLEAVPSFLSSSADVTTQTAAGTVSPHRLPGCNPYNPYQYSWVQINQTVYNNYEIPMAWGNDSSGTSQMIVALTIGSAGASTSFNAAKGFNEAGTKSFYVANSAYSSVDVGGTASLYLRPPSVNKSQQSGYIWFQGTVVVTGYREKKVDTCTKQWWWLNNYMTIPGISSLDAHNGALIDGYTYDAYNASSPYTSPQALSTLKWTQSFIHRYYTNLSVGAEIQWASIYSSVTGNYNNIQGEINGLIGLGLSLIGLITAVAATDGWSPGSGWANIPLDILAITGFVSSVVALLLCGTVSASGSSTMFSGAFQNTGNPYTSGNTMEFTDYQLNTTIGFNGNQYVFPIMDGLGTLPS